jgi:ankyrin repeat protein
MGQTQSADAAVQQAMDDLVEACTEGDLESVQQLVPQVDLKAPCTHLAGSPLHVAVLCGHLHVVDYLLKAGAPLSAKARSCPSSLFSCPCISSLSSFA